LGTFSRLALAPILNLIAYSFWQMHAKQEVQKLAEQEAC